MTGATTLTQKGLGRTCRRVSSRNTWKFYNNLKETSCLRVRTGRMAGEDGLMVPLRLG